MVEAYRKDWTAEAGAVLAEFDGGGIRRGLAYRLVYGPQGRQVIDPADDRDGPGTLGWVAPAHSDAIGLVAHGTIVACGTGGESHLGLRPGQSAPIKLACIVSRQGAVGWRTNRPDLEQAPADGFLLDCLRRNLGLATSPPPQGAESMLAAAWLGTLHHTGESSAQRLTWSQAVALHPLAAWLPPPMVEDLVRSGGLDLGWDTFHRFASEGMVSDPRLPAQVARWMDAGMFARWNLAGVDLTDPVGSVRHFLTPSCARRVSHAVREACTPICPNDMEDDDMEDDIEDHIA